MPPPRLQKAKVNRYIRIIAIRSIGLVIGSQGLVIRSLDLKISFSRIPIRFFDFHTVNVSYLACTTFGGL